ncbi:hypothetical protein [Geoglobus acetivorans]|uniref:Uncharacterized protein n=1 Tax=Geoglobus acetivorans TaxID=565033 RepID=A0ABZ3H513_GEOAI|nr:hypothetical protein [Geoglobus acetivorans]
MKNEFTKTPYSLLWDEVGIQTLLFYHLRNSMRGCVDTSLVIPEYSPKVPENAKCTLHQDVMQKYAGKEWNGKIDLCIVEFGEDVLNLFKNPKKYNNCSFWCFEPRPVIAMEIKFTWKNEIVNHIKHDIKKLYKMIEDWGTELVYLCLVTDIENERDYTDFLSLVKDKIVDHREKFRIAVGTWYDNPETSELWKIEKVVDR